MGRPSRIISLILFATGGILALDLPALADPSFGMAWGGYPTVTIGLSTLGIGSVIVILIEAYVIKLIARADWKWSIIWSLIINVISTFGGVLVWLLIHGCGCAVIALLWGLGFLFAIYISKSRLPWLPAFIVLGAVIAGERGLVLLHRTAFAPTSEIFLCIMLQVLLGFGLSIAFEYPIAREVFKKEQLTRIVILMNVASYAFIFLAAPIFWPNPVRQYYSMHYSQRMQDPTHRFFHNYPYHTDTADSGEDLFFRHKRKYLTTPQLLGIFPVKEPVKPDDEDEIVENISYGLLNFFWQDHTKIDSEEVSWPLKNYIELTLSEYDLSNETRLKLEWLKFAVERSPAIYRTIMTGQNQELLLLYKEWKADEAKIGIAHFNNNAESGWIEDRLRELVEHDVVGESTRATIRRLLDEEEARRE
jgi:hypothetical protein